MAQSEKNEKLMLVVCDYSEWSYNKGEYYWAVSEFNSSFNKTFYKVIHNSKHEFLNCPSKESMLEVFNIISEKEISFEEKQKWAYGSMRTEHPEYFPASEEKAKELSLIKNH